ncbi:hypothetical protein JTB14_036782 [Gonioctena quinquepunctata]|nr:hypothetical protein JTB14_036782 [Gonioctena quinquepunctata]
MEGICFEDYIGRKIAKTCKEPINMESAPIEFIKMEITTEPENTDTFPLPDIKVETPINEYDEFDHPEGIKIEEIDLLYEEKSGNEFDQPEGIKIEEIDLLYEEKSGKAENQLDESNNSDSHLEKSKEDKPFKCEVCGKVLHKSCAERLKLRSNGDHKVECCQSEVNQRLSVADSKVLLLEKQQVELENKYLKELLDEMKDKNNIPKIKTVKQQEHKPTVQRGNKPTLQQEDKSTSQQENKPTEQQENKPTEQQELKPSFSSKLRQNLRPVGLPSHIQRAAPYTYFPIMLTKNRHLSYHFKKPVACSICGNIYRKKKDFLDHYATHNIEKHKVTSTVTVNERVIGKQSTCRFCSEHFLLKSDLAAHEQSHRGKKIYDCKICLRKFPTRYQFVRHERIHTGSKPFECAQCPKAYAHMGALNVHQVVHRGEKKFPCEHCPRTFFYKSGLERHLLQHQGGYPFKCTHCSKSYPDNPALAAHLTTHTGERPFSCVVCSKAFRRQADLTQHLAIHNERPFACAICEKRFSRGSQLKRHHPVHVKLKCEVCPRTFQKSSWLKKHMAGEHSDKTP